MANSNTDDKMEKIGKHLDGNAYEKKEQIPKKTRRFLRAGNC
jgi:hypothetical protein